MKKMTGFITIASLVVVFAISNAWACLQEGCGCPADPAKAEVSAAIEAGDYETWKSLASKTKCSEAVEKITPENFPRLAEAHRLAKEGKKDEARAIRAELLGSGGCPHAAKMKKKGHKKGHKKGGCSGCNH